MTKDIHFRIPDSEWQKLHDEADAAGQELGEYLRVRFLSNSASSSAGLSTPQPLDPLALDTDLKEARLAKLRKETETLEHRIVMLKEQGDYLHTRNVKIKAGLPVGVKVALAQESDKAEGTGFVSKWCMTDKVTVDTPEELAAHKEYKHAIRELEPGELWSRKA